LFVSMRATYNCCPPESYNRRQRPDGYSDGPPDVERAPVECQDGPLYEYNGEEVAQLGDEQTQCPGANRVWRRDPDVSSQAAAHTYRRVSLV
jgi:hypothetical protein